MDVVIDQNKYFPADILLFFSLLLLYVLNLLLTKYLIVDVNIICF